MLAMLASGAVARASIAPVPAPQGSWVGRYGSSGYVLGAWKAGTNDLVSLAGASVRLDRGHRYLWQANTSDVRALQSPDKLGRTAATYYDRSEVRVSLHFSARFSGDMRLYAVDWAGGKRRESITVGGQSATLSHFAAGAWTDFPISVAAGSTVTIVVKRTAGVNAVLSGIFLDADAVAPAAPPPLPFASSAPPSFLAIANYSNQPTEAPDLDSFNTKWWLGGQQLTGDHTSERNMLQNGYHFVPIFPTGKNFPGQDAAVNDIHYAQSDLSGTDNHYYGIGNEENLPASDYGSPAAYIGQFDTYASARSATRRR